MNESAYPTDLTAPQWELRHPLLPTGQGGGRPPADRRRVLNGLLYLTRAGCAWRLLPHDFGPWQTVSGYFRTWKRTPHWEILHDPLRGYVRVEAGKRTQPTAAILDSQTVRSADHAGPRGYDAAKKTTGRKRHLRVDTLGMLLGVGVTPAEVAERVGARRLLAPALRWFGWLRCLWADQGYDGPELAAWLAAHRKTGTLRLEVLPRLHDQRGFVALAHRWVVERTFGWFMKQRRLVRDYETKPEHAEAMIYVTMIGITLRRLA